MFQLTDIGTNISAPMSVKVTVIPFSLFTAYQFLSSYRCFNAPESKMRPSPSCVCRGVSALMMEMIATSFFFVYCVSNFEFRFYFKTALTTAWRRVTIQHLRRKEWCVILCSDHIIWPRDLTCAWPHSFWCFLPSRPHAAVGVFLSCFLCSSSLPAELFWEALLHLKMMTTYHFLGHGFDHILDHSHIRSTRR